MVGDNSVAVNHTASHYKVHTRGGISRFTVASNMLGQGETIPTARHDIMRVGSKTTQHCSAELWVGALDGVNSIMIHEAYY